MTGFLLLAVALILYGSLYPWDFHFRAGAHPWAVFLHSWPARFDRFVLRDSIINVLFYVPLGVTAFLAAARRYSRPVALTLTAILAVTLSTSIELLQVYDQHRYSSLWDLLCNSVGAGAGAVTAMLLRPQLEKAASGRRVRDEAAAALLALCWFGYQLYPFFPVLSWTRLRAGLSHVLSAQGLSMAEVGVIAAGWFGAALLLEALFHRLPAAGLAVTMACLPAQFLIPGRSPGLRDFLGAGVALLLWSTLREKGRLRAGLWLLLAAILVRELEPFHFQAAAQPFHWIPFTASLASERQAAVIRLFEKAFYYGGAIWLWHARKWSYGRAGWTLAVGLAVLEGVQRYLPGRTPEITDSLLALLMALVMSGLSRRSPPVRRF